MQQSWHYKDEATGVRVGPVEQGEVERLIADGRLQRSTVVWNPQMPDWAKAGNSDLAGLFGAIPPPLPPAEINRGALYAVALFPVWGVALQAAISGQFEDPRAVYDHPAWILPFVAVNCILGWLDERSLERAGLKLRGAPILSGLLVPVYIFLSCQVYHRHAGKAAWLAYAPVVIWVLSVAFAIDWLPNLLLQ